MVQKDLTIRTSLLRSLAGHYEMFAEPFKNRQNRENQDQRENKERGKHLALNTTSGKGAWRTLKVNATSVEDKATEQETAEAMATATTVERKTLKNRM